MGWPEPTEYNEAIQSPHLCFADDELRKGQPVTNALGLPVPCAGNFALVYQLTGTSGQAWAVKCFTRQAPARRQRYQAISEHLRQAALPFMVEFHYLEEGIRVGGQWFPAVKMRWVEGFTLNALLRDHVERPQVLQRLAQMWLPLAQKLRRAGIAHADLQHGNVLLVPSQKAATVDLRLIDYDGMFIPSLAAVPSGEVGHPNYQHPQRLREGTYGPEVDRFPHLVVYTALRALHVGGKALWERHDNAENLLFREQDFREPAASKLFEELLRLDDPDLRALVGHLLLASQDPLERVPLLEELIDDGQVLPLTPREQKRLRDLLPGGGQAAPVPAEPAPAAPTPAPITAVATPLSAGARGTGGEEPLLPSPPGGRGAGGEGNPAAPPAVPVSVVAPADNPFAALSVKAPAAGARAPRRSGLKRSDPKRPIAAEYGRSTVGQQRRLIGLIAGGVAALGLLIAVILLATRGPDETALPLVPPGRQPPVARAGSLTLDALVPVTLKAGERTRLPVRLALAGVKERVAVQILDLPDRVRQVHAVLLAPDQTEAVLELEAELGAPEAVREARVVARAGPLEAARPVNVTVGKQAIVSWLPTPAVVLKQGESKAVPLRVESKGHEVPLELVIEGLPEKVRLQGDLAPLPPGQTETQIVLAAAADAPQGEHKARVLIQAGGVKLAEQTLDIRVGAAGLLKILRMQEVMTTPAGFALDVNSPATHNFTVIVQRERVDAALTVEVTPGPGLRVAQLVVNQAVNYARFTLVPGPDVPAAVEVKVVARAGTLEDTRTFQLKILGGRGGEKMSTSGPPRAGESVQFSSVDEVQLGGTFYPGARGKNSPCALLLHGLGEDRKKAELLGLAGELQRAGFAILSFDFRGHGDSTEVRPAFWNLAANKMGVRGYSPKRPPETISFRQFANNYYSVLVNDVAAAKVYLDQRGQLGQCNPANLVLIGVKEGATVGAIWLNAECHRYRVVGAVVNNVIRPGARVDAQPEGRHVAAAVWVSIQPQLGNVSGLLPNLLLAPARQHVVPLALVYGEDDARGKALAKRAQALIKKSSPFTGVKAVPDTNAVGSALLAAAPATTRWIADYATQAVERRALNGPAHQPEAGHNFLWRLPRGGTRLARGPADRLPRFDTFADFLR